jgi:hypothetical protein
MGWEGWGYFRPMYFPAKTLLTAFELVRRHVDVVSLN